MGANISHSNYYYLFNLVCQVCSKLKLHIGAFIDLTDRKSPEVSNLIFIYSIHNRHLVMC